MATPITIEIVLVKLGGVFPSAKIGADGIETYGEMLEDIPDEVLIQSMRKCLMVCRFFPTIAEIREKAEPFLEKLRIEQIEKPDEKICKENAYRLKLDILCRNENVCQFAYGGKCLKYVVVA